MDEFYANRKNIHLDFLNPDLRRAWGIYHINSKFTNFFLKSLTNLSVFLTKEKCFVQPVFFIEDFSVLKAVQNMKDYFEHGYIILPMKLTDSMGDSVKKVLYSYRNVHENYPLFNDKKKLNNAINFLENISFARIEKKKNTGILINQGFLSKLDYKDKYWREILKNYNSKEIGKLQKVPMTLLDKDISITHGDILQELGKSNIKINDIHKLLNYEYGQVYMDEFDTVTLYNIFHEQVFSPTNRRDNKGYDFQIARKILTALGIDKFVFNATAQEIIQLRNCSKEYHQFIKNYFYLANKHDSPYDIEIDLANIISRNKQLNTQILKKVIDRTSLQFIVDTLGIFNEGIGGIDLWEKRNNKLKSRKMKVAIFIALKEEENIAKKVLNLKFNVHKQLFEGQIRNASIELFSPRKLGRVAAAVETYKYLVSCHNELPDLLIVAGIAGGFAKKNIERGDIIVPNFIIDVSNTKKEGILNSKSDKRELFRFHPFELFTGLADYLNSPIFNLNKWIIKFKEEHIENAYNNKTPNIIFHPISCCDSVIKDEEWIDDMLKIHPEICGVEMESGGVCYAAQKFGNIKIAVIRGVSDLSNPYKADDSWRLVSMLSISHLIKNIDFTHVLNRY